MRKFKYLSFIILASVLTFFGLYISVDVLNSDLYGRLIETEPFHTYNSTKKQSDSLPTVTLIMHKYLSEENSIEASLIINYNRQNIFKTFQKDKLEFTLIVSDGYSYNPIGSNKYFTIIDSSNLKTFGYGYFSKETERFILPIAPSLNGFPFDNILVRPLLDLYVNEQYSTFNFVVQKRPLGRVLSFNDKDKEVIQLTRTSIEKYLVVISSILFLLLTTILTYSLFNHKSGLNTVEELLAVAGYILATAGFREIVGITRSNGTSALEILVILIPLLSVSSGLIFSFIKGLKTRR